MVEADDDDGWQEPLQIAITMAPLTFFKLLKFLLLG